MADGFSPGFAPAKVNLSLHVTGRRADGYHLLDSLVVFAGVGDRLAAETAPETTLAVDGPRAEGVPVDGRNLVLRAAETLIRRHNPATGARMTLTKVLPHAAGIGGGSSDAAAALRLLSALWGLPAPGPDDPGVVALGADVPVCLAAPQPRRMQGIGESLTAPPALPPAALVLVNPGVAVPTAAVFRGLGATDNPAMTLPDRWDGFADFAGWLRGTRNDLQAPAMAIAPPVAAAIAALAAQPGIAHAVMSGSGATCAGLAPDIAQARRAAQAIARSEPGWWVVAAPLLS